MNIRFRLLALGSLASVLVSACGANGGVNASSAGSTNTGGSAVGGSLSAGGAPPAAGSSASNAGGAEASSLGGSSAAGSAGTAAGTAGSAGAAGSGTAGSGIAGSGTGAVAGGGGAAGASGQVSPFSLFRRGINLGNRLDAPTEGAWGPTLNAADFPLIAARGFDHVRLPVRFSGHAAASAPYTIDPAFFARVDWAIKQALDAGLAIIVDLHHYDEIHLDPAAHQDRFVGLWTQIAARYRDQPDRVAFELLNEPSAMLNATWNTVAARALAAVRQTNPSRLVIVDSTNFASASSLPLLQLPPDVHLMVSVHLYEPSLFCFQGQAWMGPIWATTQVVYPGPPAVPLVPVQAALDAPWAKQWFADYNTLPASQNPSGPKTIQAQIQQAQTFTQRDGRPVYNGEWGPQNGADLASRARYMRDMRDECEKAGLLWAIWDDATNMKLFDSATGVWDATLTGVLFP
jgi:endoglucanase